jgi:hypothetical protein
MGLKPCPFCGGEAKLFDDKHYSDFYFWVGCINEKCPILEVVTEDYSTKDEALKAWNTRIGK